MKFIKLCTNKKWYYVVTLLLVTFIMFCSLAPRLIVRAADTSSGQIDERYYKYVPFADSLSKTGSMWYSQVNMSKFDDVEDRNLQTATLEVLENNKYFKAFISKYYPTYSDFKSTFDMYALVGSYYQEYKYCDTAVMIVEKGSKVCYVKDLSDGQWGGGYNEMIFTNSEHIFAIIKPSKDFKEDSWAFYDGSGDAGQSGINKNWTGLNGSYPVNYATFYMAEKNKCPFAFTNCPVVNSRDDAVAYFGGDDSVVTNKNDTWTDEKLGCDSFGWDSFDCSLTPESVGDNKLYRFIAKYDYSSFPKMIYAPEDYRISLRWTLSAKYTLKSGVIKDNQWSSDYLYYDLDTYKSGMNVTVTDVNFKTVSMGKILSGFDLTTSVIECIAALQGCDVGDIIGCSSCDLYLSVMLWKSGFSASSDVRSYKWDCKTLTKTDLSPDVKVTTDGDGKNKKVTEVVGNDGDKTVINITVNGGNGGDGGSGGNGGDGGNGGSGGDGGSGGGSGIGTDDDNSKSFWKILKGIVAFFKALLDGEDGLFPVIAAFFDFIPASFWTVVIGSVVVIAVISIYRLLKKS